LLQQTGQVRRRRLVKNGVPAQRGRLRNAAQPAVEQRGHSGSLSSLDRRGELFADRSGDSRAGHGHGGDHVSGGGIVERQGKRQQMARIGQPQIVGQGRVFAQDGGHGGAIGGLAVAHRLVDGGAARHPGQRPPEVFFVHGPPDGGPRQILGLLDHQRRVQPELGHHVAAVRIGGGIAEEPPGGPVEYQMAHRRCRTGQKLELCLGGGSILHGRREGDPDSRRNGQQAEKPLDELQPQIERRRGAGDRERLALHQRGQQALDGSERVLARQNQVVERLDLRISA